MEVIKTIKKNLKATIICLIVLASSGVSFEISYYMNPKQWSTTSLFFNLAIALVQLFLALLIVNVYLANEDRKKQDDLKREHNELEKRRNTILFNTVLEPIKVYNKHFNSIITDFGVDRYNEIIEECKKDSKYPDKMDKNDIDSFINTIKPQYKMLLCEIKNTAILFQIAISSGILNDNPDGYEACIIALQSCNYLNSLDIDNPADCKLIFRENVIFYGQVTVIAYNFRNNAIKKNKFYDRTEWLGVY